MPQFLLSSSVLIYPEIHDPLLLWSVGPGFSSQTSINDSSLSSHR